MYSDSKLHALNRLKEVLILVGEICILCLDWDVNSEKYYDVLGWVTVGSFGSALVFESVYLIRLQLYNIKTIIKEFVETCKTVIGWFTCSNNKTTKCRPKTTKQRRSDRKPVQIELPSQS